MSANYRTEAQTVRAAAQAKLSELRAKRWEKRAGNQAKPVAAAQEQQSTAEPSLTEQSAQPVDPVPIEKPKRKRKSKGTVKTSPPLSHGQSIKVSAAAQSLSNSIEQETPEPESAERTVKAATEEKAEPETTRSRENAANSISDECDLAALPGIGDGLIRLFAKCGVHSLEDLANANTETLKSEMGLPGELLNLESWVAVANEKRAQ